MTDAILTQAQLRELFIYDPNTGNFFARKTRGRFCATESVGTISQTGYCHIHINRKKYFAHRLAWLYMIGEFPAQQIDHKNGIRHDNRWFNLRSVSYTHLTLPTNREV